MINRYLIYERYEHWGPNGKAWSKWFITFNTTYAKTEAEAKEAMKHIKKASTEIDKHTKLKHEYEIRLVDVETLPKPPIRYSKKGRPSKSEIEQRQNDYNNFWKNYIKEYDRTNKGNS